MDSKRLFRRTALILIRLSPLVYLASVYPDLKQVVPIHFDLSGRANGYGSKQMLMYSVIFLCGITAGVYALIKFLSKIDPRKSAGMSPAFLNKIGITLVIFLSVINFMLIYSSLSGGLKIAKLFAPLAGCFFIYMGNLMHSVKPNYFVGIRVPWTLNDRDNWRATHRLGSKVWVVGGFVILLGCFFLPQQVGEVFFMICSLLLAIIPITYSFFYFTKHRKA